MKFLLGSAILYSLAIITIKGLSIKDESESVETFKNKMEATITEMPDQQQLGARKVHVDWYGKALKLEQKLAKKTLQCDALLLLFVTRNGFEHELLESIYPRRFPQVPQSQRFSKCVIAFSTGTGKLAETYRNIIEANNMTIWEFCGLGCEEMYTPMFKNIHLDVKLPPHCLNFTIYWEIAQSDPILRNYLLGGHGRLRFISTLLELLRTRAETKGQLEYDDAAYLPPSTTFKCASVEGVPFYTSDVLRQLAEQQNFVAPFNKSNNGTSRRSKKFSLTKTILEGLRPPQTRLIPLQRIKRSIFKAVEAYKMSFICETEESFAMNRVYGNVLVQFDETIDLITALSADLPKTLDSAKINVTPIDCSELSKCEEQMTWKMSHPESIQED